MTGVSTGTISQIAWNGPRPLGPSDELIGRDREMDELIMQLQTYDIVELTAYSGVGKTSFVQAGVIPELTKQQTHVPEIVAWPDATSRAYDGVTGTLDDTEAARRLYRVVLGLSPDEQRPVARALQALVDEHEGGVVVVLDQFEELLRFQRGVAEELLRLAGRTARDANVTHLVIARSEFKEMLRPIEVNGAAVWAISLSEIQSESVLRRIVESPAAAALVDVDEAASVRLFSVWDDARKEVASLRAARRTVEGLEEIGLLHFQSLLWAFREWASHSESGVTNATQITPDIIEGFLGERSPRSLLKGALVDYMTYHADRLAEPCHLRGHEDGPPLAWRNGPRLMLSRIAPAMTSAGYKQPQSLFTLVPFALADELTQRTAASLARDLQDDDKAHTQIDAELADIENFGAGIADGWDKQVVVQHMLECLQAALQHMSSGSVGILREFERPGQQPIYELVHDGMGSALTTWAEGFSNNALSTIGVIAAQPGRVIRQDVTADILRAQPSELWGDVHDDGTRMRVSGLKWPASLIDGVTIENIEFVGCNFTGTSFEGCTLRHVTFRDCSMLSSVFIKTALLDIAFVVSARQEQFDSDEVAREGDRLNLVTFVNPRGAVDVEFRGLVGTTGVFLQNLSGGEVRFKRCSVTHLVATASAATKFVMRNSVIRQATFDHRIDPDRDESTVLSGVEWVPSQIESD